MTKPNLTPEGVAALQRYAEKHGRTWKSKLRDAWMGMPPHDDSGTLRLLRNQHGADWLIRYQLPKPEIDGPWEMSGPEGDDGDDTVLVCNHDADNYEVITITEGTLAKRKSIARRIAALLNEGKAVLN